MKIFDISGEVGGVSQKQTKSGKDRFGLLMHGKWYNGWGTTKIKKGELVKISYFIDEKYGNEITATHYPNPILPAPQGIETPKLKMHVEADAGLPSPKDTSIVRQSCIRSASMKNAGKNTTGNEDVELARIYEKYIEEG